MENSDSLVSVGGLSMKDLQAFGLDDVAYVRRIIVDDQEAFSVHAADGTPLCVEFSVHDVVSTMRERGLQPVQIH